MLKGLTLAQFGNYTCEAENDFAGYCRRKTVEIGQEDAKKKDEGKYHCVANNTAGEKASNPAFLFVKDLAFLAPETVEDPKNQTVVAGFNLTLNCTAKGSPMPSITWIKNNDSLAIQSNPRIKYIKTALDDKQIHSQLVIEDAKKEDKGKYHCVANNTAGEKASDPAFLSIEDLSETYAVYYFLTWHQPPFYSIESLSPATFVSPKTFFTVPVPLSLVTAVRSLETIEQGIKQGPSLPKVELIKFSGNMIITLMRKLLDEDLKRKWVDRAGDLIKSKGRAAYLDFVGFFREAG
ncbi:unnamed protein product [Pocillopora meandrina]|uniref:Ig-like domain-containing protein n=1 Tax=Pocillopora meandrina TaxID=46732 RepID=A0AAU9XDD0_9CNID|nr:unnamed protein product [Pocillopora meandrina]